MKLYKFICISLIIFISIIGCNQSLKKPSEVSTQKPKEINHQKLSSTEISDSLADFITSKVFALKEVKELDSLAKIYAKENKTERVSLMIKSLPNYKKGYYWVQVGVEDTTMFLPQLNFLVDSLTYQIKYYDAANDSIIPLNLWRKNR